MNYYELSLDFGETMRGEMLQSQRREWCGIGYPHSSLMEFFMEEQVNGWNNLQDMVGTPHHLHRSWSGKAGYHSDLKPHIMPVYHDDYRSEPLITDFGLGYLKVSHHLDKSRTAEDLLSDAENGPALRDSNTQSILPTGQSLLQYRGSKENDRFSPRERPSYHRCKDRRSEILLGLCWGFGLLIFPAYREYKKDYQMDLTVQNRISTWVYLALVLSFAFGHYSSLIGMGCKFLGNGDRWHKNAAAALMVPILALLSGLLSYGIDSEILIVMVLPQCFSVWITLIWWWTGVFMHGQDGYCEMEQQA